MAVHFLIWHWVSDDNESKLLACSVGKLDARISGAFTVGKESNNFPPGPLARCLVHNKSRQEVYVLYVQTKIAALIVLK